MQCVAGWPAYPGDELDELDILVDRHVVLGDDALLTSRKQQLKNESNAAIMYIGEKCGTYITRLCHIHMYIIVHMHHKATRVQ